MNSLFDQIARPISQDEDARKMQNIIDNLRAIKPLMKQMGDALERFAEEDVEHDLPTSPFAGMHHLRKTGSGV